MTKHLSRSCQGLRPLLAAGMLAILTAACEVEHRPRTDTVGARTALDVAANCGVDVDTVVSGSGIGDLRIGRPWNEVANRCRAIGSPENADFTGEGVISVDLFRDTAMVELRNGRIAFIELQHSDYRTADSIGVRTPLVELLRVPGIEGITIANRLYAVSSFECGIRFELMNPAPAPPAAQSGMAALTRLPGETRVRRIAIVGC